MGKAVLFIIGAVLGLVIGGIAALYFFGGVPRASEIPGKPIQMPDSASQQTATANISLNQQFFNTVLDTIFRDMNAPAFPLNLTGQTSEPSAAGSAQPNNGCDGNIILVREGSGVQTSVQIEDGKISAPLAFQGSTSVLGSCIQFTGWAQASMNLRFDESQQTVFGQVDVQTVNLDGVSPIVSSLITPIVQTTLNNRVNPVVILRGDQIALNLPINATDGTLAAKVTDVRADLKPNALSFFVTYNFSGTKNTKAAQ